MKMRTVRELITGPRGNIRRWGRGRRAFGPLALFSLLLVALTACGGAATATVAPQPSASSAAASAAASSAASAAPAVAGAATASTAASPAGSAAVTSARPSAAASAAASNAPSAATGSATPRASAAASGAATPAGSTGTSTGATRYTIDPTTSKATYTVQETFVGRGVATAVGSATGLTGAILIDKGKPSASTIEKITIDISKLASDSGQRDSRIRREWLESDKYPTATFVAKRLEGLPETAYTDGQELTFTIVGDLTIRTTTKEVTFEAKGKIVGDTFTGTATTGFNMTDFGFNPPDIAGVLKSENAVKLDLEISAKR